MSFVSLFSQLAIFPLRPIVDGACTCALRERCGSIGKHPAILWSTLERAQQLKGEPGCGHGIATGVRSGVFVIDCDGEEAIRTLFAMGEMPDTLTVERGYAHVHFYFRCPDFLVKTSVKEIGDGIDVRGEGGYVVAPSSLHRSGMRYEIIADLPVADAPQWLLDLECLRRQEHDVSDRSPQPVVAGSDDEAECIEEATKMLTSAPPAIAGQKGHGTLWIVAQRLMRSFELPIETAFELIQQHYNPRCIPAWSDREIYHKLEQGRDKGRFELRSDVLRFNREIMSSGAR